MIADVRSIPRDWYQNVKKANDRANTFKNELVALHQTNSVVVGKLTRAVIDKLWNVQYPYCKVSLEKAFKFSVNGVLESELGSEGVFWVNKPEIVLSKEELAEKFPKVYREVLPKIKKGVW